jgi:hypothetical protein
MIRTILLLLGLITLSSCARQPQHVLEAERVMDRHINEVTKGGKLFVFGTGGTMMDDVEMLALNFFSQTPVDLNGARLLIVESVEKCLTEVNSDPKIYPYLHEYPFTAENLDYLISFKDQNYKSLNPPFIAFVFLTEGKLYYDVNDPEADKYVPYHEESYEEALAIVRGERAE